MPLGSRVSFKIGASRCQYVITASMLAFDARIVVDLPVSNEKLFSFKFLSALSVPLCS